MPMRIDPLCCTAARRLISGMHIQHPRLCCLQLRGAPSLRFHSTLVICVALPDRRPTPTRVSARVTHGDPPPAARAPIWLAVLLAGTVLLADPHSTSVLKTDEEVEGQRPPGAAGSLSPYLPSRYVGERWDTCTGWDHPKNHCGTGHPSTCTPVWELNAEWSGAHTKTQSHFTNSLDKNNLCSDCPISESPSGAYNKNLCSD